MNIKILHINTNHSFEKFEKFLPMISEERRMKISQLHFDKDKNVSLFTEFLIKKEVFQQLHIPYSKINFMYGECGKPYLTNNCDYHFSVSHSENCIAFVSNNCPIGIDLERIATAYWPIAKRFFTPNEYIFTQKSRDPNKAFYKIWTAKEAYVKMLGLGLSKSFRTFDILSRSLSCAFKSFDLSEYIITVCSEQIIEDKVIIKVISEDELFE